MASTSPKHAITFQTGYLQPAGWSLQGVGSVQSGSGLGSKHQEREHQAAPELGEPKKQVLGS